MQPPFPIYLLRHGQTEWNRDDRRQGQLDSPLTEKGFAQAEAMGRTLAKLLQFTSPLTGEVGRPQQSEGLTGWRHDAVSNSTACPITNGNMPLAPSPGLATLDHPLPLGRGHNWRLVSSPLDRAYQTGEIISVATNLTLTVDERLMELRMGSWEGLTWPEIDALGPRDTASKYPQFTIPDGETWAQAAARAKLWLASIDRPTVAVSHGLIGLVLRCVYLGLDQSGLEQFDTPRQDVILYMDHGKIEEIACS